MTCYITYYNHHNYLVIFLWIRLNWCNTKACSYLHLHQHILQHHRICKVVKRVSNLDIVFFINILDNKWQFCARCCYNWIWCQWTVLLLDQMHCLFILKIVNHWKKIICRNLCFMIYWSCVTNIESTSRI